MIKLTMEEANIVYGAAEKKKIALDDGRLEFSEEELSSLGVVREHYSLDEIKSLGFTSNGIISSFDDASNRAKTELRVGAPFVAGVLKWQLPIDVPGFKTMITQFPPGSVVLPHVHPIIDGRSGGGLRTVTSGSIIFDGREYLPGDWFFVPNGMPYSFSTNPTTVTSETYIYIETHENDVIPEPRFSAPHKV